MTAKKKQFELTAECKAGRHIFIVTVSATKGGVKKATSVRCQHCLQIISLETLEWEEDKKA